MRLPTMTTQRWMVFVAVFAATLTVWVLFQRWVAAKVAGFLQEIRAQAGWPPEANLGDFSISVTRDMAFWMDVDHFFHRFWFAVAILAVLFSFVVAAMFPRGRGKVKVAGPPVRAE